MKLLLVILSILVQLPCIFAGWLWATMRDGWRDGVNSQHNFKEAIMRDLKATPNAELSPAPTRVAERNDEEKR